MCFSPQASFTAGIALTAIGVATVTKSKKNKGWSELPFAAIPLLFAAQQITEGFVWLSLEYHWPGVQMISTFIYVIFAYVWWPLFIPLAIGLLEIVFWRKRIIQGLQCIGIAVGGYLLYYIVSYPIVARVVNSCIAYRIASPLDLRPYAEVLYIIAALGPCFISSRTIANIFGAAAAASLLITY